MNEFTPTRTNLDKAKRYLSFARSSHSLLDRKRKVLVQELMERISLAKENAIKLEESLKKAYDRVIYSNILYGSDQVDELAKTVKPLEKFEILQTSIMGVSLPKVSIEPLDVELSFGIYRSGASLDQALKDLVEVRELLFTFVEEESAISRLAYEIKRTAKRVNSIEKIQIPRFEEIVRTIEDALAEKEREDLFRLKIVKKKLN